MGTITLTVGATGRQYTSIQAAIDAIPANLVTDGNSYVVELHNDAEFALTSGITISKTTDATHFITVRPAAGKSFRDNANVATNALAYNPANGVAIKLNANYAFVLTIAAPYTIIEGLQLKGAQYTAATINCNGPAGVIVRNNILDGLGRANAGTTLLTLLSDGGQFYNNLCVQRQPGNAGGVNVGAGGGSAGNTFAAYNNTIVAASGANTVLGFSFGFGVISFYNNVVLGFGATGISKGNANVLTGSNNATDGTFPTELTGTLTGLVIADQFVNSTSGADYRLKDTSALKNAGTATGAPSMSINTANRSQGGAPDIGAWEIPVVATVPAAPTGVAATATGNGSASVTFTPGANGDSAITGYTVTASTGQTATGAASPITVSGLAAGSTTFTVTATNGVGTSAASSPSAAITIVTDSVAPTVVSVEVSNVLKAGAPGMLVTFSESIGSGVNAARFALSGHTLAASPVTSGSTLLFGVGEAFTNTEAPTLAYAQGAGGVLDLAGNQLAAFTGRAVSNTSGATVPNAPTNVIATAGDGSVSVAFTAPANNGGKPITGYKATASTGQTATGSASPIVVTVPNGVLASFTVTAINALGESSSSAPSGSVSPAKPGDSTVQQGSITILTRGIGAGKTFATLDLFCAFINGIDCVATNQRIKGIVYEDQTPHSLFRTINSDASRFASIEPAPGLGVADFFSATTPENYGTQGIELTFTSPSFNAFTMQEGGMISGFRINIPNSNGRLQFSGNGTGIPPVLSRNRIKCDAADGLTCAAYGTPVISDNLIVRSAAATGWMLRDNWRATIERNTFVLLAGATASAAMYNEYGPTVRSNAFHGFATVFTHPGAGTKADNYTNIAPAADVGGLTADTVNPFFVNATSDFRPAAALLGKGGAAATSINDNIGNNRGLIPDVGAFQLNPQSPLPQGVVTVQTMDGATLLLSGSTTNTPVSGKVSLSPDTPANGASSVGPLDLTIAPGTFSVAIDDLAPGNYLVTATLTNAGGTTVIAGSSNFEVVGMGNLVYDGGGVGTGGGGTEPTLPAPTITISTIDTAIMSGKRATISGAVNLNGDANGQVSVFLDPQPSGTPAALGAANVTAGTWTKQTDIAAGLYKLRVVATSAGQSTTASTGNIRVLGLTGNFTLPTA
jgi:hypothetical protein